jgi:hypothetical protein
MDKHFGGVIWTNHALERLRERGISQSDAWATWNRPDQSRKGSNKDAWVYYKTYGDQKVEVVAKKNELGEWLILSVWSRPLYNRQPKTQRSGKSVLRRLYELLFVRRQDWK